MTARDLLQQRYTLPNGDTAWRPSPLVTAAIEGKLLLLDGIHRVNLGTLAVLSRYSFHHSLAVLAVEWSLDIISCVISCVVNFFSIPGYSMTGSWICMMGPGCYGGTDTKH